MSTLCDDLVFACDIVYIGDAGQNNRSYTVQIEINKRKTNILRAKLMPNTNHVYSSPEQSHRYKKWFIHWFEIITKLLTFPTTFWCPACVYGPPPPTCLSNRTLSAPRSPGLYSIDRCISPTSYWITPAMGDNRASGKAQGYRNTWRRLNVVITWQISLVWLNSPLAFVSGRCFSFTSFVLK